MQQKIVITGGPGTGKSAVIKELERRNYFCMHEISRQVTLEARNEGIEQLFLEDPLLFSSKILDKRTKQYNTAHKLTDTFVFFDRGIPDIHSYLNFKKTTFPSIYVKHCHAYRYSTIFLMPPWKEIYTADNERYESYEDAKLIYEFIKNGYIDVGYSIIEIPFDSVKNRTNFILESL
jgi:predicted ATPase